MEENGDAFKNGKSDGKSSSDIDPDEVTINNSTELNVQVTTNSDFSMSMRRRYVTAVILFFVNLLNYTDRYTIPAVLKSLQTEFKIGDGDAGLLQAIFVVGYMVFSPVFGYLGDRYNRKYIMVGGVLFWSAVTLAGSFVTPNYFWVLVLLRGLVGIGEASYSTIAPTLISDMFVGTARSRMLMLFYFAIPVGSGLGYMVGGFMNSQFGGWENSLRFTPGLGVICAFLLLFVTQDPPRGMAEKGTNLQTTSIREDLKDIGTNKSYLLTTAGGTCVAFVSGALAFFAPKLMLDSYRLLGDEEIGEDGVAYIFGVITMVSGFAGVAIGTETAKRLKTKWPNADPIVCAAGLISASPFLLLALVICEYNMIVTWAAVLIGEILVFLNWSLMADILMYVVIPTRRGTASAMQIFSTHLLGDAGSPYLLGIMSDALKAGKGDPSSFTDFEETFIGFKSLQNSLYVTLFICVLGGGFFLFASLFVVKDRAKADVVTKGICAPRFADSAYQPLRTNAADDDMAPLLDDDDYLTDEVPAVQLRLLYREPPDGSASFDEDENLIIA